MHTFSPDVVAAVVAHMNGDHVDDNLLIARAFGRPDASSAVMRDLDGEAGIWSVTLLSPGSVSAANSDASARSEPSTVELRVPWLEPVTDRPGIRRAVVLLYRAACERLGVTPRGESD